jgi:DNA-3-methyladenine glycosylase II
MFKDKILENLHKKYGPHKFADRSDKLYEELIESIINQQLSIKAADTIYKRFLALFNGKHPTPDKLINTDLEKLRSAGMSFGKASYIKNIAHAFENKHLETEIIKKMSDEDAIKELTKIKGVGKWTAEMTLIFTLQRPDVFSLGDAGLKRAIKNLYGIEKDEDILKLAQSWKPNRSYACWLLWRSLENV